ncbi:uncharacterized protein [Primulina eburnea]|uniref:uncharacterized protein n=1 Tax=Primulina eburnea TaxID=1245227 RepID=UPI003C6C5836
MYNQNSEHKSLGAPPMSPRISFSIDFVEPSHSHSHSQSHARPDPYRDAPVSSDFAFSVSNNCSMMSGADELFCKGRILPYKEGSSNQFSKSTTTLRDELQNEEVDGDFSSRPPKNPTRWRGFLGLRKPHISSKKSDKYGQASVEKRGSFHYEDINNVRCSKNSQESVE